MKGNLYLDTKGHKSNGKYVNIAVAMMVTAILFLILCLCTDIVYCLNDDLMIQSILSGRYSGSPSGKAVYLSEPLSGLLAFLYGILPSFPWLGLLLAGSYVLCFYLVLYVSLGRLMKNVKLTGKRLIIGISCVCAITISVFCGFFLSQFLMIHYTVAAAVLGGTAIYLFLMLDDGGDRRDILRSTCLPVVLLLFCYLIRTKVFFMVLPFLAVAGLYRILRTKKFFQYLRPLAVLGTGILLLMLIGRLCYHDAAWQEYLDYNDARTELYDYGKIWEGEEAEEYYASQGYAPEEIAIYREYNVLLNEALTAEDYRKIAAYGRLRPEGQRTWFQQFKEGFWLYRHRTLGKTEDYPYNVVTLALYIMAALVMISGRDKKGFWMIVLLGVVRSCLWIYLLAAGRYPERIIISLYLIELLVLLAMITDSLQQINSGSIGKMPNKNSVHPVSIEKRIGSIVNRMGIALAGIFLIILSLETAYQVLPRTLETKAQQLAVNSEEDRLFDFMKSHPENLYLLDVYSVVNHTEYAIRDYDDSYENYLLLGGWIAGSPLVTEKLTRWGYESAFDALERGENVYLVLKEDVGMGIQELEDFYFWRTGKVAVFQQVEAVGGRFHVYQKMSD
ncbi:MAG: hypothetical protein K2K17_01540 [Lachnospiraceae bacterium]|nr:hypothetical protein [Lachnospiraceae bacterium]